MRVTSHCLYEKWFNTPAHFWQIFWYRCFPWPILHFLKQDLWIFKTFGTLLLSLWKFWSIFCKLLLSGKTIMVAVYDGHVQRSVQHNRCDAGHHAGPSASAETFVPWKLQIRPSLNVWDNYFELYDCCSKFLATVTFFQTCSLFFLFMFVWTVC